MFGMPPRCALAHADKVLVGRAAPGATPRMDVPRVLGLLGQVGRVWRAR